MSATPDKPKYLVKQRYEIAKGPAIKHAPNEHLAMRDHSADATRRHNNRRPLTGALKISLGEIDRRADKGDTSRRRQSGISRTANINCSILATDVAIGCRDPVSPPFRNKRDTAPMHPMFGTVTHQRIYPTRCARIAQD
ncbi:unnamed protein product, partial [Iphiclides podalirius]